MLLFVLACFSVASAASLASQAFSLRSSTREGEERIRTLAAQKEELEARIREYQTTEGVIREAKARLNLKNPGEKIVVVLPDESPREDSASKGFFARIRGFFAGILAK